MGHESGFKSFCQVRQKHWGKFMKTAKHQSLELSWHILGIHAGIVWTNTAGQLNILVVGWILIFLLLFFLYSILKGVLTKKQRQCRNMGKVCLSVPWFTPREDFHPEIQFLEEKSWGGILLGWIVSMWQIAGLHWPTYPALHLAGWPGSCRDAFITTNLPHVDFHNHQYTTCKFLFHQGSKLATYTFCSFCVI